MKKIFLTLTVLLVSTSVMAYEVVGDHLSVVQQQIEVTLNQDLCNADMMRTTVDPYCEFNISKLGLPEGGAILKALGGGSIYVRDGKVTVSRSVTSSYGAFEALMLSGNAKVNLLYQGPILEK